MSKGSCHSALPHLGNPVVGLANHLLGLLVGLVNLSPAHIPRSLTLCCLKPGEEQEQSFYACL